MADTEPGERTPATDEPPTGVLPPPRWSGAAPVPEVAPRRSLWGRLADRINGEPRPDPEDYWATVPAVDPWAGQDTPVWTTEHLPPVEMPPTRWDTPIVTPATRLDVPARTEQPATAAAPGGPGSPGTQPTPGKVDFPAKIAALLDQLGTKAAEAAETRNAKRGPADAVPPNPLNAPQPGNSPKPGGWFRKAAKPPGTPAPNRVPVQPRPPEPRPAANRPPWAAPPRPRRKRRRLRRLMLVAAILAALWFGAPYAYDQWPALGQFPAVAELPDRIGDLRLRVDEASQRAAGKLADQLSAAGSDGQAFAGVYSDSSGKRITVYGVTGWRFTPQSDVSGQLDRISGDTSLSDVQDYDIGEFGAFESCGAGRVNGTSTVICTWADHGSMATVLLTRRSVSESAELVARLRGEVLTPKLGHSSRLGA